VENSIRELLSSLEAYPPADRAKVAEALEWASALHEGQKRASGEPYIIHPVQTAQILVELGLDSNCIVAGLLHDVLEDTACTGAEIRARFGAEVEAMVDGVTKIALLAVKNKTIQEAQTIRKMLLTMAKDIRVILIKLADKLNNMRTLQHLGAERQKAIATECLDIYAPLSDRLGISWLKDELEDLALKALNREVYEQIKSIVAAKKGERADFLKQVQEEILEAAREEGLEIRVESRAKHFYSIYQKMRKRNKSAEELYDLLGIRIICSEPNLCYQLLGIVHRLWKPIEGRFKDYIAMPKANGYRSLHTTVMSYEGKLLEIQIRTAEMHGIAEFGVASHWVYKKGSALEAPRPADLAIVAKLKSWEDDKLGTGDFLEEIKRELLKDSIYVFTPKGEAIELPSGATAVDFAFHIHTDIGSHCFAAKADGMIIPLNAELKNTQVIEILTSPASHPHLNWLRTVRTSKARTKIRQWLEQNDETLIFSKNVVAKKKAAPPPPEGQGRTKKQEEAEKEEVPQQFLDQNRVGVRSGGVRNMMIHFAGCCSPATGDPIVGYVSRGRGIIVHKRSCRNIQMIPDIAERGIEVEWETVSPKVLRRYRVTARRSNDLFSEIEGAIRKRGGHLVEGKIEDAGSDIQVCFFTVEIEDKGDSRMILSNIKSVPLVLSIEQVS
jgi:GTP pyrophosphokinase